MSFLTIAGITVQAYAGTKQPPEFSGSISRAYAGNLRITRRWEKRVWKFQTIKLIEATCEQIEAAIALGAVVQCSGTAFDTITVPTQNALSSSGTGGALPANSYFYKITTMVGSGESTPSNEKTVTTTGTTSQVTLNWTAVPGATGYRVYRGTSSNGENTCASGGTVTGTSFTDLGSSAVAFSPPTVTTYTCVVTIEDTTNADYMTGTSTDGNNFYRALSLTIREV